MCSLKRILVFVMVFLSVIFMSGCTTTSDVSQKELDCKQEIIYIVEKYDNPDLSGVECSGDEKQIICIFDGNLYITDTTYGDSMYPTFSKTSYLIEEYLIDKDFEFKKDDVYTYKTGKFNPRYVTHRCVQISEDENGEFCVMKGDLNDESDLNEFGKVYKNQIISKVVWELKKI